MAYRPVRLSGHDLAFLGQSTLSTPMNVGGLVTFAADPIGLDVGRLRSVVAARLGQVPRFFQRAVTTADGAEWVDDPDFGIESHVDELPWCADDPHLVQHVAELHASVLDPERPPWRISLLRQGRTGGAALLFRASHALVDGLASMQVMRALFDPGTAGYARRPVGAGPIEEGRAALDPGGGDESPAIGEVLRDLARITSPRPETGLDQQRYERALTLLDGVISMLEQGQPGGLLLTSSGDVRTRVCLAELPWQAMRTVRRRQEARFDELGLTIAGGGLARVFAARGGIEADTTIRALLPIGGVLPGRRADLGNRSSFLIVAVPVGPMPAPERLALIRSEVRRALGAGQHRAVAMSLRSLETATPDAAAAVASLTQRQFVDLVVSCIPGSRRRLRLDGVDHAVTYPLLPISATVPLAIGLSDIGGGLGIAVTADERALPELDFLTDGMARTGRELAASART